MSSDRPQSAESLLATSRPARWYHPLTQPNHRLFMGMTLASSTGVWMQRLAQDWLVLQLTGSPAAVGVAVALQFLPMLIVGPLGGLLARWLTEQFGVRTGLVFTGAPGHALRSCCGFSHRT